MKTRWLIENSSQERYNDQYLWKQLANGKWQQVGRRDGPNESWTACSNAVLDENPERYFQSLKFEMISEDDVFVDFL